MFTKFWKRVRRVLGRYKRKFRTYLECADEVRAQDKDENFRNRARYAFYYKHKRIKENQVLYEAFYGRGMICNPRGLFNALLKDPRAKNMHHIWVLDNLKNQSDLIHEYKKYHNVLFVEYGGNKYKKALCTGGE